MPSYAARLGRPKSELHPAWWIVFSSPARRKLRLIQTAVLVDIFLAASLIQHAMNDSNYLTEHKQLDLRSATVPLKIDGVRSSQDHDLTQKR